MIQLQFSFNYLSVIWSQTAVEAYTSFSCILSLRKCAVYLLY